MKSGVGILVLIVLFIASAARAQQVPEERSRQVVGTMEMSRGKHKHIFLVYYVHGKATKVQVTPPKGSVVGAKYTIAYDTTDPTHINTYDFTRPVFEEREAIGYSTARVLQTNFGTDIRYGKQKTDWIRYQYYAPDKPGRKRSTLQKGYAALPPYAWVDTNGVTDQLFKVIYSPANPARSILQYSERITDTQHAPQYRHALMDRKLKTYYKEFVFPVGFFMFSTHSNYNSFTFHFSDANTGTNVNNTIRPFRPGLVYGGTVQLPYISLYRRNGIISVAPVSFAFGNGDRLSYVHFGPSVGYQKQLTRRLTGNSYVLYPAVKAAAAINVSYSALSFDLGELTSANGQDMNVNGQNLSTTSSATYSRRAMRVAPELGIYVRCSRQMEFRFSTVCNIEALHYENIKFYHSQKYYANTRNLGDYLSDEQGKPISGNLFMPIPLISFRVECAFGGGN